MDRVADLVNCTKVYAGNERVLCNHGGGFLDRYDWGYTCGNCGATFHFKRPDQPAKMGEQRSAAKEL